MIPIKINRRITIKNEKGTLHTLELETTTVFNENDEKTMQAIIELFGKLLNNIEVQESQSESQQITEKITERQLDTLKSLREKNDSVITQMLNALNKKELEELSKEEASKILSVVLQKKG